MSLTSKIFRLYLDYRLGRIDRFRRHPHEVQQRQFEARLKQGVGTAFGRDHHLERVTDYASFAAAVPVVDYDTFKPYIERMVAGERSVTTPGRVQFYARSSGTTSDRSKYLPITRHSIFWNHTLGMRDVVALYLDAFPQSKLLQGKTLTLGGTCSVEGENLVGDLSGILLHETARWGMSMRAPQISTALCADFDRKRELIARECVSQHITAFAGVPSWNLELLRHILDYTGKQSLREVWPDLELFLHGGVEFAPYRRAFAELIPTSEMHYMENYNASEGFFAAQDDPARDDMLLMLDYGTFFEFRSGDVIVPLEGVEVGKTYALIITSDNGLWRYEIGDTVTFTSVDPYRIRFAGRTKQYINAFGEELMVSNADEALVEAAHKTGAVVNDYSVAPCYMTLDRQGAHEWMIDFEQPPTSIEAFSEALDEALRRVNSDYDAKRQSTIERQHILVLPRGYFVDWMRRRGKNKVPRLVNDRRVADDVHRDLKQKKNEDNPLN